MKKSLLVVVISALLLSLITVSSAMARDPVKVQLNETLAIFPLGEGTVRQVGNADGTYHWLVRSRPAAGMVIYGNVFQGGGFTFEYSGLFAWDQSGRARGKLIVSTPGGTATANVTTAIKPQLVGFVIMSDGIHPVLATTFPSAKFEFVSGTGDYETLRGNGTFTGGIYAILDTTGTHIVGILDGSLQVYDFQGNPLGMLASIMQMSGDVIIA